MFENRIQASGSAAGGANAFNSRQKAGSLVPTSFGLGSFLADQGVQGPADGRGRGPDRAPLHSRSLSLARQRAEEVLQLKTRAGIAELEVELAERENRLAIRERELAGREDRVAKREREVATREEQVAKRAKRPTKKKRGPKQPKKAKDKDRTWEQEVIELLLPDPGPNSLLV